MKRKLFGVGSIVAAGNVLAAVLQFVLLSTASKAGGMDAVGGISLALAAASALSIFLTSDCKSLSLTTLSTGASLYPVIVWVTIGTVVALIVGGIVNFFDATTLFLPLLIFKLLQAWGDMFGGLWLVKKHIPWLIYNSIIKPLSLCLVLIFYPVFLKDDISTIVWALVLSAFFLTLVELILFFIKTFEINSRSCFSILLSSSRDISGRFGVLSLTGLVTYSPQFIIRDIISAAFGFSAVGLFSIHYQILLIATPIISAISQVVMSQNNIKVDFIFRSGLIAMSVGTISVVVGFTCIYALPSELVRTVFYEFTPLPVEAVLLLGVFAISMYLCVYLGFLCVKLNIPSTQLMSSVFFVAALVLCWFFRYNWSALPILLGTIVISLLGRVAILSWGVSIPLRKLSYKVI